MALDPQRDKALARGQHLTLETTADPPADHKTVGRPHRRPPRIRPRFRACPARSVPAAVVPPGEPFYRTVTSNLLPLPDQPHLHDIDDGRSYYGIAFSGRPPDRRFVDIKSGKWSDRGRTLRRLHLPEVSAPCAPPSPPQPAFPSVAVRVSSSPPRAPGRMTPASAAVADHRRLRKSVTCATPL